MTHRGPPRHWIPVHRRELTSRAVEQFWWRAALRGMHRPVSSQSLRRRVYASLAWVRPGGFAFVDTSGNELDAFGACALGYSQASAGSRVGGRANERSSLYRTNAVEHFN